MADNQTLDPEFAAAAQQIQQANAGGGKMPLAVVPDGLDPEFAQAAKQIADQDPPRVSPTGQTIEPQPNWQNTWKGITGNAMLGSVGAVKEASAGLAYALGADFSEQKKQVEDDAYLRAQTDAEDYANTHGHDTLSTIIGGGVRALPLVGIGLGSAALGALAAPAIGVTAVSGSLLFSAATMGTLATGQAIYGHTREGWDKPHAVAGGLFSGAVAAGMQLLTLGASEKAGADTLQSLASTPSFRQALTEVTGHIAKAVGVNAGLAGASSVADSVANYLLAAKPKTMQQALADTGKEFYENALSGVIPSILIGGGAAAIGVGARMNATPQHIEALRQVLDRKTQQIYQAQIEAETKLKTLKGYVEESEAEAATARERADKQAARAEEAATLANKEGQKEQKAAERLRAALVVQTAKQHEVAEFGPANFSDEERLRLLYGNAEIDAEDQLHAEDIQTLRDELELAEGHFNELREKAARRRSAKGKEGVPAKSKKMREVEQHIKRLEARLAFAEENFRQQRELEETRDAENAANEAFRARVQEKLKVIKQESTARAARLTAEAEAQKAGHAQQEAQIAESVAADMRQQHAAQQQIVEGIPNRELAPAERRAIIRAGLAIKTAAGAGRKVLDVLAQTGDYDEAAKALINHEPTEEPTGEEGRLHRLMIYKDTAGLNLDGLLRYVFQHAPPAEQEALVKMFSIDEASNKAEVKRMVYQKLADTYLQQATGLDENGLTELMHAAATTKITGKWSDGRAIAAPDEYGNMHKMSVDEAMSYLLWAENADAQAALFSRDGNNFPRDFEITLTEAISQTEGGQKFLDALNGLRGFYAEMGPILKEVHDRATGGDLPLQVNHGGTIRRVGSVQAPMDQIASRLPGQEYTLNPGTPVESDTAAVHERGALETAIVKRGAFANAHSHAVSVANYEANVMPARLWDGFVNNPVVSSGIVEKWGEPVLEMVRNRYRDQVHGVPAAQQSSIEWIDNMMRANRVSVLGANPVYTAQHWFTLFNFFLARDHEGRLIPVNELADGFTHFFLNKKNSAGLIMSWPEVQARYDDVNTVGGIVSGEQTPQELNYEKNALKWFRMGDMPALEAGTYAVYHAILGRTGDPELAQRVATQSFHDCLASGSSQQWTELTTHKIAKLFTAFEQPSIRLRQHSFEAKLRANNFPTAENFADQLRTEIVARTASTVFLAPKFAVALADAAILGNPSSLVSTALRAGTTVTFGNLMPGAGVFGESVLSAATGGHYDPDVQTPVSRVVIGGAKALGTATQMATGHTPLSFHHIMKTIIGAYQGAALIGKGKPVAPMIWLDRIFGGK